MGLLDNLIKRGVSEGISKGIRDAVSGAVEKAVNPVAQQWANKTADDLNTAAKAVESSANEVRAAAEDLYEDDGLAAAVKIRKVLAEDFSQYEVKENVSPETIGGVGQFMNYSFGVYAAGTPVLFIMLVGKTTCSSRLYRWSKEAAAKNGTTMINFVEHYPNNVTYIKERLSQYLK